MSTHTKQSSSFGISFSDFYETATSFPKSIDLLLSWRHSGFNIHNHTTVYPNDTEGLHRLACYLHRAPVNLSRLRFHPESGLLIYEPKAGQEVDDSEPIDPLEFLARVLIHISEPNKHLVHLYVSRRFM